MVNIYKFHKFFFDPTTWRTARTTSFINTGRVEIYWRIFEANFNWLLSFKISQLETLKLLEVLVKHKIQKRKVLKLNLFEIIH